MLQKKRFMLLDLLIAAKNADKQGDFNKADLITNRLVKISQNLHSLDVNKNQIELRTVDFSDGSLLQQDFDEAQQDRQSHPRFHPNYKDLGGDTEEEKAVSIFDMQGEDSVPGPAYVDPEYLSQSPGMAMGDLSSFTWKNTYEKNVNEGHEEKNKFKI